MPIGSPLLYNATQLLTSAQEDTKHMHTQGCKTNISGSEHCQKWYFLGVNKLKSCHGIIFAKESNELIFLVIMKLT